MRSALLVLFTFTAPVAAADPPAPRRLGSADQRAPYFHLRWLEGGERLFGGSPDFTHWRVWDSETGKLTRTGTLPSGARGLTDPEWHAGGRLFGAQWVGKTNDMPGAFRFVEYSTLEGKVIREWTTDRRKFGLGWTFSEVTLSPDGKWAVGYENDMDIGGDLHVLNWKDRKYGRKIDLASNAWSSPQFHFTPDGTAFVMCERFSSIGTRCFELATGNERWSILNGSVRSHVFTQDGELWLVDGDHDKPPTVSRRSTKAGVAKPVPEGIAVAGEPHAVTVTPDDRLLIVSGSKGTLVWDRAAGKQLHLLPVTSADLLASPDSRSVVTCNGLLQKWDLETGKPLWDDTAANGHTDSVTGLTFGAGGKRLYSSGADGTVRVWDVATAKTVRTFALGPRRFPEPRHERLSRGVYSFAVSESAKRLATMGTDTPLQLWDLDTGKELKRLELPAMKPPQYRSAWGLRFSADGKAVTAIELEFPHRQASGQARRLDWDAATGKHTREKVPTRSVWANYDLLAPDHRHWFDSYNRDLYALAGGKETWSGRPTRMSALAFNADGTRLAFAETVEDAEKAGEKWRSALVVREVPSGKEVTRFALPEGANRLAFDPRRADRVVIASGGEWQWRDAKTGEVLWRAPWPKASGEPSAVAVSASGVLASGHPDGSLFVLELPVAK